MQMFHLSISGRMIGCRGDMFRTQNFTDFVEQNSCERLPIVCNQNVIHTMSSNNLGRLRACTRHSRNIWQWDRFRIFRKAVHECKHIFIALFGLL